MSEPRLGDAAVGTLIAGQFAHHLRFGTGVAEHIDEVEYDDVQFVSLQLLELLHEALGIGRVVYLVIRERLFPAVALHLCLDEWLLVQVLALFFVFVDP